VVLIETVSHRFNIDESNQLKQYAMQRRTSLNDLIAACIFRGCSDFRESLRVQSNSDWIRMMVPVNLRTSREDHKQTACNIVSSIFLDRTPVQINDADQLVQSIRKEMELIKNNRLAFMFIFSIWIRKLLTFRVRELAFPKRCQTSVVFSNLGKLFSRSPLLDSQQRIVAGGKDENSNVKDSCKIIMESFEILAPLNPYMYAAFTTSQYAKRLLLSIRYDGRVISRANAQALLDATVSNLTTRASEPITT